MNRGFGTYGVVQVGSVDGVPAAFRCRRCRCGRAAECTAVVMTSPFRTGRRYEYACTCSRTFWVRDLAGIAVSIFRALATTSAALLLVIHPPGGAVGEETSNRAFGFGLMAVAVLASALAVHSIRGPFAHPRAC